MFINADPCAMPLSFSYICDEYKAHRNVEDTPAPEEERGVWRQRHCQRCPQQTNGYDCGVFTIMAAEYLGLCKPWDYGQQHMNNIRVKMMSALKHGKLMVPDRDH